MKYIFICISCCLFIVTNAQQKTFRKFYNVGTATSLKFFDTKQTIEGGYISTGLHTLTNVDRPLIIKTDCNGNFEWGKYYGVTSGASNIFMKVITTTDSGFVMLNNTGGFNAFNILVVKYDKSGNEQWKKLLNNGSGNDVGQSIVQTADKGFVITGYTNTFGSDQGSNYDDILLAKLDSAGNFIWGKSYGKAGSYNQATKVILTNDGGFALTGRYIEQGTFFSFLMKTDDTGKVVFLKTWGDTLHATYGLDLIQDKSNNYLICGTTTVDKTNYLSYTDHFLAKFDSNGDSLWTRLYHGTSQDMFESPYSICFDPNDNIILGIETNSYPSNGIVLNRQGYIKTDANGHLLQVKTFNDRQSQYTRIYPTADNGYVVNGFTSINSTSFFRPSIFKLDSNLSSGCGEIDVTSLTVEKQPVFKLTNPAHISMNGGIVSTYTVTANFVTTDTTLCAVTPPLNPSVAITNLCIGDSTHFTYTGNVNALFFTWHITSLNGYDTVIEAKDMVLVLPQTGNYTAKIIVSDGCATDSFTQDIIIQPLPIVNIVVTPPGQLYIGDTAQLSVAATVNASFAWSTGDMNNTIYATTSDLYLVAVTELGCTGYDSVYLTFDTPVNTSIDTLIMPNAFTPEGLNKVFKPIIIGNIDFQDMKIYNRWGNEVFTSQDAQLGWNGTYRNSNCSTDVYYYVVRYKKNGITKVIKGDVLLLR